jgi:hypothetical protein
MHGTTWRRVLESYNRYGVLPPPMAGAEGDGGDPPPDDKDSQKQGGEGDDDKGGDDKDGGGDDKPQGRTVPLSELQEERKKRQALEARLAAQDRKEREASEEAAKKSGEFERLYNETKSELGGRVAELEAELFRRDAERELLAYLGDKHPSYMGKVRWLWPVLATDLKGDMDPDAVKAVVKKVADDYVKDNPMASQNGNGGAPGAAGKGAGDKAPRDPLANFGGLKEYLDRRAPVQS